MTARTGAYDVAVIGLGAMGSAALYHLALRGQRVIGIEQATPGHAGGSSHGESRIIRMAYFEHPSYVPLLRSAYAAWRDLEQRTGQRLLTITGILEAGCPGSGIVSGSLASSQLHDLPHELLTGQQINARFPAFALPADWSGVFQPDGGYLRPELAIETEIAAAKAHGAEVRLGAQVRAIDPSGRGVRVTLTDGTRIDAGAAIVAAGPWIGELAPELAPHLKLTRQVLAWFDPARPLDVAPGRFPIFILETPDDAVYGFPDFAGTGVKAASHIEGRGLENASCARQDADEADARQVLDVLEPYVPAAAGPVRAMTTCIYTRTPDQDFILDAMPGHPQILLASPCSGHGFKFSILIGQILADLALTGATDHDICRFTLRRFQR